MVVVVVVVVVAGEVWSGFEVQKKGQPVLGLGGLEALVFDGMGERAVAACWGSLSGGHGLQMHSGVHVP